MKTGREFTFLDITSELFQHDFPGLILDDDLLSSDMFTLLLIFGADWVGIMDLPWEFDLIPFFERVRIYFGILNKPLLSFLVWNTFLMINSWESIFPPNII